MIAQNDRIDETITNLVPFFLYIDWFLRYPARPEMVTHRKIHPLFRFFVILTASFVYNYGSLVLKLIRRVIWIHRSNEILYVLLLWQKKKNFFSRYKKVVKPKLCLTL